MLIKAAIPELVSNIETVCVYFLKYHSHIIDHANRVLNLSPRRIRKNLKNPGCRSLRL